MIGSLDNADILEEQSAGSNNPPGSEAIMHGANRRTSQTPVFVIHTSGMGILTWKTVETNTYGGLDDKVYSDWEGVSEVTSLPNVAAHRDANKSFLNGANGDSDVKLTISSPPSIYGVARGLGNTRSKQLYDLSVIILSSGKGTGVGRGENRQTHINVYDLSDLYVRLIG